MAAPTRSELMGYAQRVAVQYGIDPAIFLRQIQQESGFDPNAHNPSGATGIAQLMPQYYPSAGQDPYADLESAARTDAANLKRFGGDYAKMLAAYDAGAGAVEQYGGVPPYQETQTYVQNILGGGGNTMDQNQGDTTDLSALVDQAINGDTPSASGVVPDGNVGTADQNSPIGMGGTSDANNILQMVAQQKGGAVRTETLNPTVKQTGGVFGSTTAPNREPTYRYWFKDGTYLDVAALDTGSVVKGGTALKGLSTTSTAPKVVVSGANPSDKFILTFDPATGAFDQQPNPNYQAGTTATPKVQFVSTPNGGYGTFDPTTGDYHPLQGADPNDVAYKQALTQEAQARTQTAMQALRPVGLKALQDADATITAIQQQYVQGKITMPEMNQLMAEVHQGVAATLAGTTLFEQQKQQQAVQLQKADLANSLLSDRVRSATSLGQSLFNAAVGHVLLPKGQKTLGIDPLAIANQEVNTMGGGAQTGNAAAAFLQSLFGQSGGESPPVANGQAASSFPTTREAVLAAYPHLGAPPAQPNAQQQMQTPQVQPQTPLSPMNQAIQAGVA